MRLLYDKQLYLSTERISPTGLVLRSKQLFADHVRFIFYTMAYSPTRRRDSTLEVPCARCFPPSRLLAQSSVIYCNGSDVLNCLSVQGLIGHYVRNRSSRYNRGLRLRVAGCVCVSPFTPGRCPAMATDLFRLRILVSYFSPVV